MNETDPQNAGYRLHPEVAVDLRGISEYIERDSLDAANQACSHRCLMHDTKRESLLQGDTVA